jgi:predicted DNA-binding transcriptional regulator YafY
MNTIRVRRIIQILTALQSVQRYRVGDLARLVGTSRRTIFRDLKTLQEAGIPCHFDQKDCCYTINPQFCMLTPELSEQEALGLLLLVHKARENVHFPLKDSALKAAIKIETNLPNKIKQFCNAALRHISIKPSNQERCDSLDQIFSKLLTAILRKQIVTIQYHLPSEHKNIITNLSPYHLMYNDQIWYVLGMSSYHNGISNFKLKNIKELKALDKCFIEDKNFNVSDYLGRAWSMIPEGRLYNVKLRFLPEVAFSVAETQWHSTQKVTFENDGSAIIEFRVDGLNEIFWWILSYGDQVQVLAPQILRQKILETAKSTIQKNEKLLLS